MMRWLAILIAALSVTAVATAAESESPRSGRPLVLAHYMPWFVAKPHSATWGWHWTMDHFDPDKIVNGQRKIASHLYPLIGPYDSGDRDVIEYHLLTMKLAGIDGVIVDWYGRMDHFDYALLHRNTLKLVELVERFGMKLAVCFEDQVVGKLVAGGKIQAGQRVGYVAGEIKWLADHWFRRGSYVRLDGQPVLLSFGQTGLTDAEWTQVWQRLEAPVSYFSEHRRRSHAVGAFDWPIPSQGLSAMDRFEMASRGWPHAIPVVFPRFHDIYQQAGVSKSHGRIADRDGQTLGRTLARALRSGHEIVQLATWNDWGEGTAIEPSREYGYRDLERLQQVRRQQTILTAQATRTDLRLPLELLLRRRQDTSRAQRKALDRVAGWLAGGQLQAARDSLAVK